MRRLFLLLCLLCSCGIARAAVVPDTLRGPHLLYNLEKPIRYHAGDNLVWASPSFSDSAWPLQSPMQRLLRPGDAAFPSPSWWRLPIVIESSLAGTSLALSMTESGSADVYLDGKLLHRFNKPDSGDTSKITGKEPFIFPTPSPGWHLLAIRFSQTTRNARRPGFALTIGDANEVVAEERENLGAGTAVLMTLFGVFLAFSILHLIMFFYYRAAKSNLWFAVFSFCLGLVFVLFEMKVLRVDWGDTTEMAKTLLVVISIAGYSLSGLVNNLFFGKRNFWVRLALLSGLMLAFALPRYGNMLMMVSIIAAGIEAVIALVLAVWRRRPGARIIAGGMLLFIIMLIVVFSLVAFAGGMGRIALQGVGAIIIILLIVIAILSIPLSMSAYLAWNFASMTRQMKVQFTELERLSEETRRQEAERQRLLESRQQELEREVALRTEELRGQKQKSDDLLLNILPSEIAEELKEHGKAAARQFENVSVLFTDFADFTQRSEALSPEALIGELDECFRAFDRIIGKYGLEKIKTVGDAYIAVSGLPTPNEEHAANTIHAALEIQAFMQERIIAQPNSFHIRLGIHSGPVIAGIVGVKSLLTTFGAIRSIRQPVWNSTVSSVSSIYLLLPTAW